MTNETAGEPSLDEILSSIRRIISEDGPSIAAASFGQRRSRGPRSDEADDVLVLTRRAPVIAQAEVAWPAPASVADPALDPEPVVARQTQVQEEPVMHQEPTIAPAMEGAPEVHAADDPPAVHAPAEAQADVIAPETEASAAAAFEKLTAATRDEPRPASLLMPAAGRTLEDVVRDIMRPLLKEWLDENLPAIVQARVDEEIERIARHRVR
jgi:cell pole-organizing protein PopZ